MKKKSIFFILIPIAILILGMIGYCGYLNHSIYGGLLDTLKLLKVEFGEPTGNIFVEAARWLGILFYFSLLYAILFALYDAVKMFAKVRHKDSVAVHGDSAMAQLCAKIIHGGRHCVLSDGKESFRAKKQIIWFSDDVKSMRFYEKNKSLLAKDDVYIVLNTIPMEGSTENHVHILNVNENIAANYWESHFITEPGNVVIIGSGALAEEMLEQALLMNVYSKNGGIRYHVIGDFNVYNAMHPALQDAVDLTHDEITFTNAAWYTQMEAIRSAGRIILADKSKDNTEIARLLLNYGIKAEIHLMSESDETKLLFKENGVMVFGTLKELLGRDGEMLFQEGVHQAGKLFDAVYGVLAKALNNVDAEGVIAELLSKTKEEWIAENTGWDHLSSFLKRSNYAAAKHSAVKQSVLKKALSEHDLSYEDFIRSGLKGALRFWNAPENKEFIEGLEEVEHLRWWRLYLLNNFTYNENVKDEDKWILRQNKNMKDYALLDEQTKRYDGLHYWLLSFLSAAE